MPQELHSDNAQSVTLSHYLAVLRRRKWIIVTALVIVPLAAILFSLRQERLYQASAEVLLSRQNLAANLTGVTDPNLTSDPTRMIATQADIASIPLITERTLAAAGPAERDAGGVSPIWSVSSKMDADILVFSVSDPAPAIATRLASEYARQYTLYRRQLDTASILRAEQGVKKQMADLRASGSMSSGLYAKLADRHQQLREMEALQTANATVIRKAGGAALVQPRTRRNVILGVFLGLMFGVGLAFLYEALDTRVRTAEEVGRELEGLPLLARLPELSKRLRQGDELVMFTKPNGVHGEAFRMLRANLDFVTLERDAKTIMVTSALAGEGKTTTASNLALALARGGRHVILADLDLRRPRIEALFGLAERPGLTNVLLGKAALEDAITLVSATDPSDRSGYASRPAGDGLPEQGTLGVLHSGPLPPSPGELVGTHALAAVLAELSTMAEIVLIDAPPLLEVGDAMTLSKRVDAMLIVTRLEHLHRSTLRELARTLEQCPAHKLGFVLTGVEESKAYGYGYGRGYGYKLPDGETVSAQSGENE